VLAVDDEEFDELLRGPARPAGQGHGRDDTCDGGGEPAARPGWRASPSGLGAEPLAKLLDAAVLVVQAFGNLATVAEDLLTEQRDSLRERRATPPPPTAGSGPAPAGAERAESIDLTY
jgi:hypothetical protein